VKEQELRGLIKSMPGNTWADKVEACANLTQRSKGTVYKWLGNTPPVPDHMLDVIRYRTASN